MLREVCWTLCVYSNGICITFQCFCGASQAAHTVKNLPANTGHLGSIPGFGKIPEKGMECDVQNQWKVYSQEKQTVGVKTDLPWEGTAVFCHILQTLS